MPADAWFPWLTMELAPGSSATREKKRKSKTTYSCPACRANVWGKPGLRVMCRDCDVEFAEVA